MKKVIAAVIALCVTACLLASCQIIRTPIKNVFIVDNAKTYTLVEDVPQSGREKLEVSLARNEKEGCQFILRFDEDVSGVSVKVSDITNENGEKLDVYGVYREHYVTTLRDSTDKQNFYPDAMIPLVYDDLNSFEIKAKENQGIYITLSACETQSAGKYTGTVTVRRDNGEDISIPLEAEVWDFAIPKTNTMETSFQMWFFSTWDYLQRKGATNLDYEETRKQYADFQLEYRIEDFDLPDNYDYAPDFARKMAQRIKDGTVTSYRIPIGLNEFTDSNGVVRHLLCQEDGSMLSWPKAFIDALDAEGILEYGYVYVYDEPSMSYYNDIRFSFDSLKKYNPKIRCLVTSGARSALYGSVDIFCGIENIDQNDEVYVTERQRAGDTVWWYNCDGVDIDDHPCYLIGYPLVGCRTLNWMQKDLGITGNLYWATSIQLTKEGADRDIWNYPFASNYRAGDGFLIYSGVEGDGVINRNIPVPSLRLEAIRDGMEDYEYLCLMENKINAFLEKHNITDIEADTVLNTYYDTLYTSRNDYDHDPAELLKIRKRLAHDIMADDNTLVTMLPGFTYENTNLREIRVYAPKGSDVTCDGVAVTGSEQGDCAVYSAYVDMSGVYGIRETTVTVNGEEYTIGLKAPDEVEFETLGYKLMFDNIDTLKVPYTDGEVRQNYLFNCFDRRLQRNDNGTFSRLITVNRNEPETIKKGISSEYQSDIPLIVMTDYETQVGKNVLPTINAKLFVPAGAEVKANGNALTEKERTETYSLFEARFSFDSAGRHLVPIEITYNGKTETVYKIINQGAGSIFVPFDLNDTATAAAIDALDNVEVVTSDNGKKAMRFTFERSDEKQEVQFPLEILADGYKTLPKEVTHISFKLTNLSNEAINVPSVLFKSTTMYQPYVAPIYNMVGPGETTTVIVAIQKKLSGNKALRAIGITYTSLLNSDGAELLIEDLQFATIPYYPYNEASDVVLTFN